MSAIAGKRARIRQASATFTTSTNQTCDVSTDGLTVQVVTTSRRHWDPGSTLPRVYRGAGSTLVGSSEYTVNHAVGSVTFAAAQSTSLAFDADIAWATASYMADARGWEASADVDTIDVTTLSTSTADTQWRSFLAGPSQAEIRVDKLFSGSSAPVNYDAVNLGQRVLLDLWAASTGGQEVGKYSAWAWPTGNTVGVDIGDPVTEGLTFTVDGALHYSTA